MPEIIIRRAIRDDANGATECIQAAYAQALVDIPDMPNVAGGVADDITGHQAWVAVSGRDVVGFIVFDQVDDCVMIFNLAVSPLAQGEGLARKLMNLAEKAGKDAGLHCQRLRTHQKMQKTVSMYQHLGWVTVEVSGNSILMEKPLD